MLPKTKLQLCLVFFITLTISTVAKDYYISPKGDDNQNGSQSTPWRTLLHACERVPQGQSHRILMAPGVYEEVGQCRLPSGVSLIGAGPQKTVLKSQAALWVSKMDGYQLEKYLIRAEGGKQRISGFTIDGSNKNLHGGIVVLNGQQIEIDSLELRKIFFNGIWLLNVRDASFHDSRIYDCSWGSTSWAAGAVHLGNLNQVELCNLDITEIAQQKENRGGGLGIKSLAMQDNRLEGVDIKNCTVTVNDYGLWQNNKAPNISIEFHNTEVIDCEISSCTLNNVLSLVATAASDEPNNMRVYGNRMLASESSYPLELSLDHVEVAYNYMEGGSGGYAIVNWEQKGKRYENWHIHDNVINNVSKGWPSSIIASRGGIKDLRLSYNTIHLYGPPVAVLSCYGPNASENITLSHNLIIRTESQQVETEPKQDMLIYVRHNEGRHEVRQVAITDNKLYQFSTELSDGATGVSQQNNEVLDRMPPLNLSGNKPFPFYELNLPTSTLYGARPANSNTIRR